MYRHFIKRFLDLFLSFVGLILLSPIILFITIGLYFANGGKPFFFQKRPGKDARIFTVIKFKTMNDKKDVNGKLLPDAKRLTPMGRFIRKTSLDEIPQILNVLIGDMSLVGPRPLLPAYLELYTVEQKRRHLVRPGITGWAQVNGRNAISWDQKFVLDTYYVDHLSFALDVKILFLTFKKVIISDGISAEGQATTTRFIGSEVNEDSRN